MVSVHVTATQYERTVSEIAHVIQQYVPINSRYQNVVYVFRKMFKLDTESIAFSI